MGDARVERAYLILTQCETHQHADGGGKRPRNEEAKEAEKVAEAEHSMRSAARLSRWASTVPALKR